jgi:hypothetical protein
VRERNGGFRADDLPAESVRGPMTIARQASQIQRLVGEAGDKGVEVQCLPVGVDLEGAARGARKVRTRRGVRSSWRQ